MPSLSRVVPVLLLLLLLLHACLLGVLVAPADAKMIELKTSAGETVHAVQLDVPAFAVADELEDAYVIAMSAKRKGARVLGVVASRRPRRPRPDPSRRARPPSRRRRLR
jgi:hypothetical protein